MERKSLITRIAGALALSVSALLCCAANAQNYNRYKPLNLQSLSEPETSELPKPEDLKENNDTRVLVDRIDAIVILSDKNDVVMDASIDDLEGLHVRHAATDSILYSQAVQSIANRYIGNPLSLRTLNEFNRELIKLYRECKQPIVDVIVPEQRITGGTVQLVVIETRIDKVLVQGGGHFDCAETRRWISCTRQGDRVYEQKISNDLFWLNQNPFRRVTVDFEKGSQPGTTNVIYQSHEVCPIRGYLGSDDTGVRTLNFGRFFAGLTYGNLWRQGGTLSYQFTTDQHFALLRAHSLSYTQPLNRRYSWSSFGSWAGVRPDIGGALNQTGESWQTGSYLTRHLVRTIDESTNLRIGYDFKSTNNNLEFAGTTVSQSTADLFQIRFGLDGYRRRSVDAYSLWTWDILVGPGGGFTGDNSAKAFNSIRPGAKPNYVYSVLRAERMFTNENWQFLARLRGQASSERLLFSETLGLGGYDTIRGYDQRSYNGDQGWIANFEVGPRTERVGTGNDTRTLRYYGFVDMGNGYVLHPRDGEDANIFALSTGIGLRYQVGNRLICRLDYGIGIKDIPNSDHNNRIHFGVTWIPGRRP